jgi:hypothetical protein
VSPTGEPVAVSLTGEPVAVRLTVQALTVETQFGGGGAASSLGRSPCGIGA